MLTVKKNKTNYWVIPRTTLSTEGSNFRIVWKKNDKSIQNKTLYIPNFQIIGIYLLIEFSENSVENLLNGHITLIEGEYNITLQTLVGSDWIVANKDIASIPIVQKNNYISPQ
jgi:hypothetical protein